MTLRDIIVRGVVSHPPYKFQSEAAVDAIRAHVADDNATAHEVATTVSLRQAAGETPSAFVKRIVGAYLTEAVTPACTR